MLLVSVTVSLANSAGLLKSLPVGPIAGGIMGCFLLLALGVYCYRHHIQRRYARYQGGGEGAGPDGQGRLRDSANENDFEELDDLQSGKQKVKIVREQNADFAYAQVASCRIFSVGEL